ncbi:SidA/IucD/PvdA family monooxygenase [Variovorax sp. H27-G14]|uniref:lysine N(6)-hydroxylase/L-ornithine N(5)-oxygenase family protein n=1 Tax=Variovorax sp. H27-G14 TaxID=3111914 RepID=UPI0038FCBF75
MIYDIIGVGFGPANIALAIALEEEGLGGTHLFLERNAGPGWQENMMLPGSDIQNHPLRDLVTPSNPRSRYSFTNFLHEHDRLFEFLNLGITYPLREEYAQYVRWAADAFKDNVRYGVEVEEITVGDDVTQGGRRANVPGKGAHYVVRTSQGVFQARTLVVAPGRSPNIPQVFEPLMGREVFHLTQYRPRIEALMPLLSKGGAVAVVGASQSGVEIALDLERRFPAATVHCVIRSYGFRLKDTSPFSDEIYFPEFVDYYFNASAQNKSRLNEELRYTNYSSVDADVLHQLYLTRYMHRLRGSKRLQVHQSAQILKAKASGARISLSLHNDVNQDTGRLDVDAVVLATGFKNFGRDGKEELFHPLLKNIVSHLQVDEQLGALVNRDYSVRVAQGSELPMLFLNGLCESTHGFGDAGSFSLLSLRAREIARAIGARKPAARMSSEVLHG